jgi:hypothetical protein
MLLRQTPWILTVSIFISFDAQKALFFIPREVLLTGEIVFQVSSLVYTLVFPRTKDIR